MYALTQSKRFRRSMFRFKRSGMWKPALAEDFILTVNALRDGRKLPSIYRDHALVGEYLGYRECHLRGDVLLIYERKDKALIIELIDIGSHSQLFG